ncbi:MAG: phosphonate C-P lyase system protein PhnH [Peptococcaceae bacterium]|nr:phosphonate C-P lyase system protein PhnH [Peptococcaceae bacterium]
MISTLTKKNNFDIVFDSQKVFRIILEAMSNPAKIIDLGEHTDDLFCAYPAFLATAMTLLDNEVSYHVCGNDPLAGEIASLTLAKQDRIEAADFVFVFAPDEIEKVISSAKYGTLADPQKSATLIIYDDGDPIHPLTFSGPGIDGFRTIQATSTVKAAITLRDKQEYEYPQGIDFLFISEAGELFAVPRLITVA